MPVPAGGEGRRTSDTPTVYLHIGTPKSGSSYLQGRLSANHTAVAEQGFFWPEPWERQVRAVRNLRALRRGATLSADGPWMSLTREIVAWQGPAAILSMEWLVRCQPHQIKAAVASLAPWRVEVVCVARDLARAVPAAWQEGTQNYKTWAWDEFLQAVASSPVTRQPVHEEFWSQHDLVDVVRRWSTAVPAEQIHLVTIPPAGYGSDLLWDRFCSVVGLSGAEFSQPPYDNPSLGAVSAQMMRRLNAALREQGVSRTDYLRIGKHVVGKQVLPPRRELEGQIALPHDVRESLSRRSQAMRHDLAKLDIHVVGDLAELEVGADTGGRDPNDVNDAEMLAAAVAALASLVAWTAQREKQLEARSTRAQIIKPGRTTPVRTIRQLRRKVLRRVSGWARRS